MTCSNELIRLSQIGVNAFWNEYLVKKNYYHIFGVTLTIESASFSVAAHGPLKTLHHKLFFLKWYLATILNILYILFTPSVPYKKNISLGPSPSHIKFFPQNAQVFRTGILNFRYLNYPHIISVLKFSEKLQGFYLAFKNYSIFLESSKQECKKRGESFAIFSRICNINRLRFADLILTYMALKKSSPNDVKTASQFQATSSFLSICKEMGLDFHYHGYQHGVFQDVSRSGTYYKLHFDEYTFLYQQSEGWFTHHLSGNGRCTFNYVLSKTKQDWIKLEKGACKKAIGFAEGDNTPFQVQIVNHLKKYCEKRDYMLVLYLHPNPNVSTMAPSGLAKDETVKYFHTERHFIIDLLVSQRSSLLMDYHNDLGTKILFLPDERDYVCVFSNPNVNVHPSLNGIDKVMDSLL